MSKLTANGQPPHPLRGFLLPLLILLMVVLYGTVGYIVIAKFSLLDAVWMTVITISTVGYNEVAPLSAGGEIFTITLIVFGVLGFLYTLGVIIDLLAGGHWRTYRRSRRMEAQLAGLRDHLIVCGYGRTGKQIAREVAAAGTPYVVVETNPAPLGEVQRDGHLHVVGDAAIDETLHRAGIDRARALVSAVDSDERNVYIVLTARSLNPNLFIVARSSYPDSQAKLSRAGANRVVSPYTLAGHCMAALSLQPAVVDVLDLVTTGESKSVAIEELVVPRRAEPLTAAQLRRPGANLLAVRRVGGALEVGVEDACVLAPGDLLVALGTSEQLSRLASMLHPAAAEL